MILYNCSNIFSLVMLNFDHPVSTSSLLNQNSRLNYSTWIAEAIKNIYYHITYWIVFEQNISAYTCDSIRFLINIVNIENTYTQSVLETNLNQTEAYLLSLSSTQNLIHKKFHKLGAT